MDGLFIWLSSLAGRIVHIISMRDIYHNFLCNRWFSRLAKILDCKDCYFPYYLSCLTRAFSVHVLLGPFLCIFKCYQLGLFAACWAHVMCHHELCPTSVSNPFSFLNASLGLTGMRIKCYQKIIILIFRRVFQNFAPLLLFLYSVLSYNFPYFWFSVKHKNYCQLM